MSEKKPWAIFWNDDDRRTGVVWAKDRKEAHSIARQKGGVAAVTDEPHGGGYNIEYDNPDKREHYFGRHLEDTMPVEDNSMNSDEEVSE